MVIHVDLSNYVVKSGNCAYPERAKDVNGLRKVLTIEEVADYLRVHRSTIYRLLHTKQLPAFKIGGDWRFNQESIDRWIRRGEGRPDDTEPPQSKLSDSSASPKRSRR
jgi:excisionase family DNA binding protein